MGVRPGQLVLESTPGSDPGGWRLVTEDGGLEHAVSERAATASARASLVASGIGAVLGLLGLSASSRHRRRAEWLGAVALVMAAIGPAAMHLPIVNPGAGAAAAVASGLWLVRWTSGSVSGRLAALVVGGAAVIWLVALGVRSPDEPTINDVRFAAVEVVGLAIVLVGLGVTPRSAARRASALRDADAIAAALILGALIAIGLLAQPPWWVPPIVLVALLAGYLALRARVRSIIDRALFASERERSAISSAETERARLARELHDEPLQTIASVILSLESRPETAREQDRLRTVAAQLRNIAVALHPPVLDDLGVVPAIESLFADPGPVPIELRLRNDSGFSTTERPPRDVEIATYRIVQEAAANAIRHAECQRIVVRGTVSPTQIAIDIEDDGHGVSARDIETALLEGHLGVASMRGRAEAIDATLEHRPAAGTGTVVRFRWSE
jgi:signal transduction histidine kinase